MLIETALIEKENDLHGKMSLNLFFLLFHSFSPSSVEYVPFILYSALRCFKVWKQKVQENFYNLL